MGDNPQLIFAECTNLITTICFTYLSIKFFLPYFLSCVISLARFVIQQNITIEIWVTGFLLFLTIRAWTWSLRQANKTKRTDKFSKTKLNFII